MTIREVEEQLGITRANVRFYEKEGLLFPKRNPLNDYRDYSEEDVEILRKIMFLRNLGVPVEQIRLLEQEQAELSEILLERLKFLEQEQEKAEDACRVCRELLKEKTDGFAELRLPERVMPGVYSFPDIISRFWLFWDKLVVWGFLALQILYSVIVWPFLPQRIPISWQGMEVTDEAGKWFFFFYLLLSGFLMLAFRQIVYQHLVGGLRCYIEEVNGVVTVGAIGYGFAMQVYTVLFSRGLQMELDHFLLVCIGIYVLAVALIVLCYRKYKRAGRKR